MSSLTLAAEPGFTEIADASFAAGAAVTDATMKSLNSGAKFAAVRNEQFWGYYKNGETIVLPISPADGYTYSLDELVYGFSWYWTGSAAGALNGTHTAPTRGATSAAGNALQMGASIDPATGLVESSVSYYTPGGAQNNTHDGILLVTIHAQRMR